MTRILNYNGFSDVPLHKAQSLIDIGNYLMASSVPDGSYLLDGFLAYALELRYTCLDEVERKFIGRPHQGRFQSHLGNIRRRSWLPRTRSLLEASDYDAAMVIIGLMRIHGSQPIRQILARLPFTCTKQDVVCRIELQELKRELEGQTKQPRV